MWSAGFIKLCRGTVEGVESANSNSKRHYIRPLTAFSHWQQLKDIEILETLMFTFYVNCPYKRFASTWKILCTNYSFISVRSSSFVNAMIELAAHQAFKILTCCID